MTRTAIVTALVLMAAACVRVPEGLEPVSRFDADRYLGTWYEIARLDHRFERGLTHVTAEYALREDGTIGVTNRGFDVEEGAWKAARGRARFVEERDTGYLKVSFFGPFYGAYVVFALDPAYQWAMVTGPSRDYLWILARTPALPATLRKRLLERAVAAGFDLEDLILVDQSAPRPGGASVAAASNAG